MLTPAALISRTRQAAGRAIALGKISPTPVQTIAVYALSKVSRRAEGQACRFKPFGIDLWARPQDWLALDEVFTGGEYAFVEDLPIGVADPVIVDLGANIGAFSAFVLSRWPGALVHSVEASPDTASLLKRNTEMNGRCAWHAHHYALWTHDGHVEFQIGGASTGRRVQADRTGVKVPAITLPMLLAGFNLGDKRIHVLKMDIEGAEQSVLAQAGAWIDRVDHLIVEIHPPASERNAVLRQLHDNFRSVREVPRKSTKPLVVASR